LFCKVIQVQLSNARKKYPENKVMCDAESDIIFENIVFCSFKKIKPKI